MSVTHIPDDRGDVHMGVITLHTLHTIIRHIVDACTESGFTPLHYAAWFDQADVIKALVAGGAKLRRRTLLRGDNDGNYM